MTLLDPDMPPKIVRSFQSKWGQKIKGKRGGRPKVKEPGYMKRRRKRELPKILRLRKQGFSYGDINKKTGISKATAYSWVKKYAD